MTATLPKGPELWAKDTKQCGKAGETICMRHPRKSLGGACIQWFKMLWATLVKREKITMVIKELMKKNTRQKKNL